MIGVRAINLQAASYLYTAGAQPRILCFPAFFEPGSDLDILLQFFEEARAESLMSKFHKLNLVSDPLLSFVNYPTTGQSCEVVITTESKISTKPIWTTRSW